MFGSVFAASLLGSPLDSRDGATPAQIAGSELPGTLSRLLQVEGVEAESQTSSLAAVLVGQVEARWQDLKPSASERDRALNFFRITDEVLAGSGIIFPPKGEIDLLRNALVPRRLSDQDFAAAEGIPNNARRVGWMRAHRKADSPFFYADCDTASVLYLAAAERLNMPVYAVDLPGHMFVRWKSKTLSLNWDPNEGRVIEDSEYFRRWSVAPDLQRLFGYGECRSAVYLQSYWEWLVAEWHCRRSDYAAGGKHFREAVRVMPENLIAQNELAWFLATCPDDSLRNGTEAVGLAKSLVAVSRRINWLDTLAAAYAETRDFEEAVRTITEARLAKDRPDNQPSAGEVVSSLDEVAAAYSSKQTYVEAVRLGKIHPPSVPASVNDVADAP